MNPEFNYENLELNRNTGKENIKRIAEEINQFKEAVRIKFESEDREKILNALDLMLFLHCDQKDRLDGNPYIIHPLEVADDLINKYEINDADLVIGALLHDSVEDQARKLLSMDSVDEGLEKLSEEEAQKLAIAKIDDTFGERVAKMIKGLTNPDFDQMMEEEKIKGIKKEKRELYKEHIGEAIKNSDVFVVKLSDFIRNAGNVPKEGHKREHFIKKIWSCYKRSFYTSF